VRANTLRGSARASVAVPPRNPTIVAPIAPAPVLNANKSRQRVDRQAQQQNKSSAEQAEHYSDDHLRLPSFSPVFSKYTIIAA
jgi:hypothetical protein